jgi:Translation elongation factor EF-1beta
MSRVLVRVRVLPSDASVDLKALGERISGALSGVAKVVRFVEEPIAFGLSALLVDWSWKSARAGPTTWSSSYPRSREWASWTSST